MTVYDILAKLAATSSRLEKEAILKGEENNNLLKATFVAALNPYINYYIRKIPDYVPDDTGNTLKFGLDRLHVLSNREKTGNDAINYFTGLLNQMTTDDAEILCCVIERDLKCGVDIKTVNKIWPGLIPTFDVCLAYKDVSGIKYPAYAQTKMDGARCHVYFDGKQAQAMSRSGKEFHLFGALDYAAKRYMRKGETWDGELLFFENGNPLPRKESNGLANKAVKNTLTEAEAAKCVFVCWDIVDQTGTIGYDTRFQLLIDRFEHNHPADQRKLAFRVVGWHLVKNEQEAMYFYNEQIEKGEEGVILKNMDFKWEPKRVKGMGKIKAEEEADLIVVDWVEGTGKYKGKMGALVCETADGQLRVSVGGGYSDAERESFTRKAMLDKIITVRYNQIIKDKRTNVRSLFLPRFIELREDKSDANSFGDLK